MIINCVLFNPTSKAFVEKLQEKINNSSYPIKLTVFTNSSDDSKPKDYSFRVKIQQMADHFRPANENLFLVIEKKADFLISGDFLNQTISSHVEGEWDWTYPTQSIRAYFPRENWQVFNGDMLDKIIQGEYSSKEQVLYERKFRVNSSFLMSLNKIKYFRRHYQATGAKKLPEDKNRYQFQYWNQRALDYPEKGRTGYVGYYRQREMDFIKEFLLPGKVLDCGCGDGRFLTNLKNSTNKHCFWVGFDFSPNMLSFADLNEGAFLRINLKRVSFAKQSFDYVYALRSIKNLPGWEDQKTGLQEIMRVCKKRLVIIDSFNESYTQAIPGYNYLIKEQRLLDVFAENGFHLLEKRYYPEPGRQFECQQKPIGDEGFLVFERD